MLCSDQLSKNLGFIKKEVMTFEPTLGKKKKLLEDIPVSLSSTPTAVSSILTRIHSKNFQNAHFCFFFLLRFHNQF